MSGVAASAAIILGVAVIGMAEAAVILNVWLKGVENDEERASRVSRAAKGGAAGMVSGLLGAMLLGVQLPSARKG